MNYRKFYVKETGLDIPNDYEVHHLDCNSLNHDIRNLVAIPKDLHKKVHKAFRDLPDKYITKDFQDVTFLAFWEQLEAYKLVFSKISLCVDFRNYLYLKKNKISLSGTGYISILDDWDYSTLKYELSRLDDYEN